MKKHILSILAILIFITVSCDDGLVETNINPNQPEVVNPEVLLPNIIRTSVSEMVSSGFGTGNLVVQYSAKIRFLGTDRYQWDSFTGLWNTMYNILRDVKNLEDIALERNLPQYQGVALVLKSWVFSILTDAYGDIPYSEALRGKSDKIYTPAYDAQQDIYVGLLADLREANDLLAVEGGGISGDILYNGDLTKWRKFSNSLRLRMLLRQSSKVDPSSQMNEILKNPSNFPIFENNEDQAILTYLTQFPNLFPIANSREGFWLDSRLSQTFADALTEINDPRLPIFAEPTLVSQELAASGEGNLKWKGVRNGELDENLGSDIDVAVSLLGSIYYENQSVAVPAEGLVMTYAELQFILAEAAEKGWINGSAEDHYLAGIHASVNYYSSIDPNRFIQVTEEYLSQESVAYTGTPSEKLVKIGTQKWVSLFFNGLQGWFEWRRTGIPELTPSIVNANNDKIPVRFRYPTEQQALNNDSYESAVARQGTDDINTKVWWDN